MTASQHDIAVGMLESYIGRLIDPECSPVAVQASANTAILIFRALGVISSVEDATYTERVRRIVERSNAERFGSQMP